MTHEFVQKVSDLSNMLDETRDEVLKWKKIRDQFETLAKKLENERSSGSYRYEHSIEDMIERAKALETAIEEVHDVLLNFDQKLLSNYMGLSDIQQIIHVGRLGETGKRDVMMADIETKSVRIKEILAMKEQQEVEMAPAGVVNFIYSHLNSIQDELRTDIKTFVSHKASMVNRLEEMLRTFKDSNTEAIEQQKDVSREAAKNRAFDCILNTKMMGNKIMAQIFK